MDHFEFEAASTDNEISDDLYIFRALIGHTSTMSLLIGRLGRKPMNFSQF